MVAANIQARMFELEQIRTWERSPQLYSDTLCSSLAAQVVFTHAPLPERARRVLSKLRQTARVVQAARDNIKDPPGIFVKVGLETFRGALNFIEKDLPRAFSALDDMHLLGDLADASTEAAHAISSYIQYLEEELAPKARASFRLGRDAVRAEAGARRGHHDGRRSAAHHRAARIPGDAGGVPIARGQARRRRSDRGVAQGEGRASRAGRARRRRRSSSSRSSAPSSIATASSRGPKASR